MRWRPRPREEVCTDACEGQTIVLVYGEPGVGKSHSAKQYSESLPLMIVNGRSPVLYCELSQSDRTDRALYNKLNAAITGDPLENVTAAIAREELKRLIVKYRLTGLMIDEFQFAEKSAVEAARTLHDKTGIALILITMPDDKPRLKKYQQLWSRVDQFYTFGLLSPDQIQCDILPKYSRQWNIPLPTKQKALDDVVGALNTKSGGVFRNVTKILRRCHILIRNSTEKHDLDLALRPQAAPSAINPFDADLIFEAAAIAMDE